MIDTATYDDDVTKRAHELMTAMLARGQGKSLWDGHIRMALEQPTPEQIYDTVLNSLNVVADGGSPTTPIFGGVKSDQAEDPSVRLYGGPFHIIPAMLYLCRWEDRMPDNAVAHIKRFMTEGIHERGNTENHWLMYYAGNFLAAERWPDLDCSWNGLPAQAIHAEAKRWILGMIERTASQGHHEYDSTGYHIEHIVPYVGLADHARDPDVRHQARQMADLLIADMAMEYFKGAWAGGHCREGYRVNTWTRTGPVLGLAYIYFGDMVLNPEEHCQGYVSPVLPATYRPPAILAEIALDRTKAHVVKKTRGPRTIYRHVNRESEPVRKYTYMSQNFALGSSQLGLPGAPAGPIDLVAWDLTWDGPNHDAKIVCNHPFRHPGRFSAFLSNLPQSIGRGVGTDKPYLQYPDRLFGASPYEQMMQHDGTIIMLYQIPVGDDSPYVNLYLPCSIDWKEREGWLLGHVGNFYVAIYPLSTYSWEIIRESDASTLVVSRNSLIDGWLLRLDSNRTGLILEAVEATDVDSFEAYCDSRVNAAPDLNHWPDGGSVGVTSRAGKHLEMVYDGPHRVDAEVVDYEKYPLYETPCVNAQLNTGKITFHRGDKHHKLDFNIEPDKPLIPMRVIG
jgi:hypothetical protein